MIIIINQLALSLSLWSELALSINYLSHPFHAFLPIPYLTFQLNLFSTCKIEFNFYAQITYNNINNSLESIACLPWWSLSFLKRYRAKKNSTRAKTNPLFSCGKGAKTKPFVNYFCSTMTRQFCRVSWIWWNNY